MNMKLTKIAIVFVIALFSAASVTAQRKSLRDTTPAKKPAVAEAPAQRSGLGQPQDPNVDMDGDDRTDYVILRGPGAALTKAAVEAQEKMTRAEVRRAKLEKARNLSVQPNGIPNDVQWWTLSSQGAAWGNAWGNFDFDTFVSADFDNDNIDDYIFWRPDEDPALSGFHWVNSSNFTAQFDPFGTFLDDPTVLGDYDGDGIDDRAVFRCPIDEAGLCHYFYRSSANPGPEYYYAPWGYGTYFDYYPCPGDYDGDGTYDLCIQRTDPNNFDYAQYVFKRSTDLTAEYVSWGSVNDFMVPGDYDGDGRTDFGARRNIGGVYYHFILERDGGGTGAAGIPWGGDNGFAVPDDRSVPGDYDGDGRTDIAVWNPVTGVFWVRYSDDGSYTGAAWGQTGDVPLAEWIVR